MNILKINTATPSAAIEESFSFTLTARLRDRIVGFHTIHNSTWLPSPVFTPKLVSDLSERSLQRVGFDGMLCAQDRAASLAAPRHSPHRPCTTGGSKSRSEDDIQYEQQPLSKPEAGATPVSTTNNTPAEALPGLSATVPAQDEPPAPDEPPTQPPPALAEQSPPAVVRR